MKEKQRQLEFDFSDKPIDRFFEFEKPLGGLTEEDMDLIKRCIQQIMSIYILVPSDFFERKLQTRLRELLMTYLQTGKFKMFNVEVFKVIYPDSFYIGYKAFVKIQGFCSNKCLRYEIKKGFEEFNINV